MATMANGRYSNKLEVASSPPSEATRPGSPHFTPPYRPGHAQSCAASLGVYDLVRNEGPDDEPYRVYVCFVRELYQYAMMLRCNPHGRLSWEPLSSCIEVIIG